MPDPAISSLIEEESARAKPDSWRRNLLWQIPVLALVCFLASTAGEKLNQEFAGFMPEAMLNCSSYNAQGSGYKAFYELSEKVGLKAIRFDKSYRELDTESAALLVVAPNYLLLPHDLDRILSWVSKGNKLVYLDYCLFGSGKQLLDKLKLSVIPRAPLEDWKLEKLPVMEEAEHVNQLILSSESRLKGGNVLIEDERGALLVEVPYGKGSCLVATLPNLCSNRRISAKQNWGNFQFLINCLQTPSRVVLFDERVHGYSNAQNAFLYLARGPAGLICLQLLLIFLVVALSLNQRFGPARLVLHKRKIAASEYIDGMARTYQKAKANDTALAILCGSFRHRLCKALSLAPSESSETVARLWSQSTQLSYDETLRFLETAEKLENSRATTEEQLLNVMKDCDRLAEATKPYLSVGSSRRLGG